MHNAEAGHGLTVEFVLGPARLENIERVESRVVGLVTPEGADESEDGHSARPAGMLANVVGEVLVFGYDVTLELCLGDLLLFIFTELVLGGHFRVEAASVEDLEHDVHYGAQTKAATGEVEQQLCAKDECPDDQSNDRKEQNEGNDDDEARDSVLRADVLCSARLLLAFTEQGDQAAEEGCNQEWEWQDAHVIDREQDTRSAIRVDFVPAWTACHADSIMHEQPFDALFADLRIL